jgi:hypothetical protein
MGCDCVVLFKRPDGARGFIENIPAALDSSSEMVNNLYSLEDEESSFITCLRAVDASFCTDWDDPLFSFMILTPSLTQETCILSLAIGATDGYTVGCTA